MPNRGVAGEHKYTCLTSLINLAQTWAYAPGILLGDFNTGRRGWDETVPFFNQREDDFMTGMVQLGWSDSWRQHHGDQRVYSWWVRRDEQVSGFRLDHAFVHPALRTQVVTAELVHDQMGWPSDHAALVLDLAWVAP